MPWCETCSKYWAPTALTAEGTCPTCGRRVTPPADADTHAASAEDATPWHFKLLVVAVTGYLGWRFVQLFGIL